MEQNMRGWDSFDIIIRRKGGVCFAGIPEVGLYAKGEDPIAALGALDRRKREIADELGADFEPFALASSQSNRQPGERTSIGSFVLKLIVVVAVLTGSAFFAFEMFASKAEQSLLRWRAAISAPQVGAIVRREIERAAEAARNAPDADKQKLVEDVRAIAERWRPVANEVTSLLFGPPPCPPGGCAKPN